MLRAGSKEEGVGERSPTQPFGSCRGALAGNSFADLFVKVLQVIENYSSFSVMDH